jgi:endonuclease YncB( thermonuclease family)
MRKKSAAAGLLGFLIFGAELSPALAGDSTYGKITEVESTDVVVLDYGQGRYNVRIIGIDAPKDGRVAEEGKQFVANLVRDKDVQIRFEFRNQKGEMVSKLLTVASPDTGIRDVGVELVKAGLVRRQQDYDYKYGELSAAEKEARSAKRGLWSTSQQ